MKILKAIRPAYLQLIAVFVMFSVMGIISYGYMTRIWRAHLQAETEGALTGAYQYIEAYLNKPETFLGSFAQTARRMLMDGADAGEILSFFNETDVYMRQNEGDIEDYFGIYGSFVDFDNGLPMSSRNDVMPPDYRAEERPWYRAAVEANGKVALTALYTDFTTGSAVITFSCLLRDDNGRQLGVVCLDLHVNAIREYMADRYLAEGGYSLLMDKNGNFITHPDPQYVGTDARRQAGDLPALMRALTSGQNITEREAVDYRGVDTVISMRYLTNGWHVALVTPQDEYYRPVREIGLLLSLIGFIMAAVLSAVLLHIIASRNDADERSQVMLDTMPIITTFWHRGDGETAHNIDCNLEAIKIFGLSGKQEYLDRFDELSPPYQPDGQLSREKSNTMINRAFKDGHCRFEWMHQNLEGEEIPCEVTLVRSTFKDMPIVVGYTQEQRTLKKTIARLRETDERMQVMFNETPLGCVLLDRKGSFIDCNREAQEFYRVDDKTSFLDQFYRFSPTYQPNGVASVELIGQYIGMAIGVGHARFEWLHQDINGEPIPTEVILVRVWYQGDYAVAGYIRDLREMKARLIEIHRLELAEESNKAKSEFLATMSHEIRTPLNAIMGITEIELQKDAQKPESYEALRRIYNAGHSLLGIINDILDLSKIEAGKLTLVPTTYETASLINDTVNLNVMRIGSKEIEFQLRVDASTPKAFIGDELRIKQILNNVLSNAIKYTDKGTITLEVSADWNHASDHPDVTLLLSVQDTGQGMTREQIQSIYDAYSRFNLQANRTTEGTGLGMNITQNLIRLMDGAIEVDSEKGLGTTVSMRIPQGYAGASVLGREMAEGLSHFRFNTSTYVKTAHIIREPMPYGKVLVVDDSETNIYVARGLLAPYELTVDIAYSGFEAIDMIQSGQIYDLIFMDHMMPVMDGIETTQKLRETGYAGRIVALTANALVGQEEVFLANGFDGFISKPIDLRQLNLVLNRMVRDRQPLEVVEAARRRHGSFDEANAEELPQKNLNPELALLFARDAVRTVATLEALNEIWEDGNETDAQQSALSEDNRQLYVVNVHAMKSALSNIGEQWLSDIAKELEQAGREKNMQTLREQTGSFLDALKAVVDKVRPREAVEGEAGSIRLSLPSQDLDKKLNQLKSACLEYDTITAGELIAEMQQMTEAKLWAELLDAVSLHLLHSDFDDAVALLDTWLSQANGSHG